MLHHFAWLPHTIHRCRIYIFSIWSLLPLLPLNISANPTQAFEDRIYITGDKGDAQMGTVLALKSWPWWSKAAVKTPMSNISDAIPPKSQNKTLQFALGWTIGEKFTGAIAAKSKNPTWKALYMIQTILTLITCVMAHFFMYILLGSTLISVEVIHQQHLPQPPFFFCQMSFSSSQTNWLIYLRHHDTLFHHNMALFPQSGVAH